MVGEHKVRPLRSLCAMLSLAWWANTRFAPTFVVCDAIVGMVGEHEVRPYVRCVRCYRYNGMVGEHEVRPYVRCVRCYRYNGMVFVR